MHYSIKRDFGKLNRIMIISETHKIQVNETLHRDPRGNVVGSNVMINIRCNDVEEAYMLYRQLKAKLNSKAVARDDSKDKLVKNDGNGNAPICQCGRPMVLRQGRTGLFFYGCSGYPQCRLTKEYNGSDEGNADEIKVEDIQVWQQ